MIDALKIFKESGAYLDGHFLLIGIINHVTRLLGSRGALLGRCKPGQRNSIRFERVGLLGKQRAAEAREQQH